MVLALVGAVYLALPRPVEPAGPPRSLPEYQTGARLVAQTWAELPTTSVTVQFIPKSDDFVVFNHCSAELARQRLVTMLTVNGHDVLAGSCSGNSTRGIGDVAEFGGVVGKPLAITLVVGVADVTGGFPEKATDIHPPDETVAGDFAIGIGEPVPVGEYPFPSRPETLVDLDDLSPSRGDITIRADRNDPDARQTIDVVWPGPSHLEALLNTPGRLEVLINGKVVHDQDSWDYGGTSGIAILGEDDASRFPPGETVTITVIPERTTGDWRVQLSKKN
ncbi:hypothetical protein [Actinophytocola sediminis]